MGNQERGLMVGIPPKVIILHAPVKPDLLLSEGPRVRSKAEQNVIDSYEKSNSDKRRRDTVF